MPHLEGRITDFTTTIFSLSLMNDFRHENTNYYSMFSSSIYLPLLLCTNHVMCARYIYIAKVYRFHIKFYITLQSFAAQRPTVNLKQNFTAIYL